MNNTLTVAVVGGASGNRERDCGQGVAPVEAAAAAGEFQVLHRS